MWLKGSSTFIEFKKKRKRKVQCVHRRIVSLCVRDHTHLYSKRKTHCLYEDNAHLINQNSKFSKLFVSQVYIFIWRMYVCRYSARRCCAFLFFYKHFFFKNFYCTPKNRFSCKYGSSNSLVTTLYTTMCSSAVWIDAICKRTTSPSGFHCMCGRWLAGTCMSSGTL